ncbi:hypothetical protein SGCZBJ_03855 [Caulobacter zeae]|uniref:Bacteriophage tail tape measure N-terminal domain-containing protein n=1 Tax=Caulobacter zeae TaxID=2055137 RepID=A0A2N5DQ13_9CAUL|nr:hypothetical protein [Caulobacter zeae]PLR28152.1 hypothetical protein SGCZBJ_03855 [Caulobacter zeae]
MARTDLEQLVYQMSADLRSLENANKRALVNVRQTARDAQREYDKLAAEMGQAFGRGSLMAGVAFGAVTSYAVKAASDASETANAFEVAFGKMAPVAQKFAEAYSGQVGRALDETQAQMAKTQLILTGVGLAADKAFEATQAIQKRSVDIGSLWNVDDAEAYQAILSGISGEAEPLKRFGVALNEAAVKAELLRLGFKGNAEDASEAAKSVARLNLIMAGTIKTDGDAIKTKDSLANQLKAMRAEYRDASVELGKNFLPVATDVAHAANAMLVEFNKLPSSVQMGGLALVALVAAGGPIAAAIEGLTKLIKYAQAARTAMAGVAAANAAAGAAGAGGAAAGAAGGGAGAALMTGGLAAVGVGYVATGIAGMAKAVEGGNRVTAVKNLLADPSLVRKMSDADIVKLQGLLRKDASRKGEQAQTMYGDFGANTTPARNALGILAGEQNARAKAKADAATGKPADPDGFKLTPDLLKPVGGGSSGAKGGKSEAEKAADLAARQADRFNAAMASAQDAELGARQRLANTAAERAKIELDRIAADEKARDEDLRLAVKKDELTQAQADQIRAAEGKARAAERELIETERDEAQRAEAYRLSTTLAGFEADILASQIEMAQTFAERSALERRALELRQAQEAAGLTDEMARNPSLSEEDKQRLRTGLANAQASARAALANAQKEDLKANILEAFDAARGGAGSLADYFGDRVKAKLLDSLADKLATWLQKLGSAGGGSGGGFLSSVAKVASSFAGMFDSGGSIGAGEWGIAGERRPEIVKGPATVISSGASLRALNGTAATPYVGRDRVIHVVTEASDYFTTKVRQEATPIAVGAGMAASQTGADRAMSAARSQNRYRIAGA